MSEVRQVRRCSMAKTSLNRGLRKVIWVILLLTMSIITSESNSKQPMQCNARDKSWASLIPSRRAQSLVHTELQDPALLNKPWIKFP